MRLAKTHHVCCGAAVVGLLASSLQSSGRHGKAAGRNSAIVTHRTCEHTPTESRAHTARHQFRNYYQHRTHTHTHTHTRRRGFNTGRAVDRSRRRKYVGRNERAAFVALAGVSYGVRVTTHVSPGVVTVARVNPKPALFHLRDKRNSLSRSEVHNYYSKRL